VLSKGKDNGGVMRCEKGDYITVRFPNSKRDAQFIVKEYIPHEDKAILKNYYTKQERKVSVSWLMELQAINQSETYGL